MKLTILYKRILSFFILFIAFSPSNIFSKEIEFIRSKENEEINLNLKVSNNEINLQNSQYILGPGDQIFLFFYDDNNLSGELTILNDGNIYPPLIGPISINGLTVNQALNKIKKEFSKELIKPQIQIKITKRRPLVVSVIGEVKSPGIYELNDNKLRVVDAIQSAGGITQTANIKVVKIKRRLPGNNIEYKITSLNLKDLILKGDMSQNLYLFDGDIIDVKESLSMPDEDSKLAATNLNPQKIEVYILGEVKKPGLTTLKPSTPLSNGILSAGGLDSMRSKKTNIELIRLNRNGTIERKKYKLNYSKNISNRNNPPLRDGDTIVVKRNNFTKTTDAIGAVAEPFRDVVSVFSLFKLIND